MKFIISTAILAISAVIPAHANAQQFSSGFINPQDETFSIRTQDGTLVVADGKTQTIYISNEFGAITELTFEQAAASVEADPTKRFELLRDTRNAIKDPMNLAAFAFPVDPTSNNPCDDHAPSPIGEDRECVIDSGSNFNSASSQGADELPEPDVLDTVYVVAMRPERLVGSGGAVFYYGGAIGNYNNPGGNVSFQRYYADDYRRWTNQRSAACDAAHVQSFVVAGAVALTAVTCTGAAASGGLAAFACGGAAVGTMAAIGQMVTLSKTCSSNYPGPGNW